MASNRKDQRTSVDLIDWFTISYKSIYLTVGGVLAIAGAVGYHYHVRNAPPPPPVEAAVVQPTAVFSGIEGTVKVKAVGTFEWVTADASMSLRKSDIVRTGGGSTAEIRFFDGTVVSVGADSLIMIEATSTASSTRRSKVAWRVSNGQVQFRVPARGPAGGEAEISTPTVTAAAGAITVEQSGESDVRVYGGRLSASTKAGDTVQLTENEAVTVDPSGKAGAEVKLPAPPSLLSPANLSEVAYPDPARAITLLAWKPVTEAASYQVLLDYSPHFNRPLVDRAGIKESSVEVRGLEAGKYYWRVAAIDADGVVGKFSDFSRFSVARPDQASQADGPPPPLTIDTVDVRANILQIKGRTEPGATVTVNGQRVDVQSDGSFNEFIQLAKLGRQVVVVKSVGINGGENEQRRSVVVAD